MRVKLNPTYLNDVGLNLQAVFDIDSLPNEMRLKLSNSVSNLSDYKQLILIGHGGSKLWENISSDEKVSANPIDDYSINKVTSFLDKSLDSRKYKFLYPGNTVISLQSLGALAGWHTPSLLRIGINQEWGSWFAYRAVVLTASNFVTTTKAYNSSPCVNCETKECISSCPAGAVNEDNYEHQKCFDYRLSPKSLCKDRCLARMSCPVASQNRYTDEQIQYHYELSLKSLKKM